jgi:hypothetical protein
MDTDAVCKVSDDEAQVQEVRAIVDAAMRLPPADRKMGSILAAIGKVFGGIELDTMRDHMPAKPAGYE